ncbi:MAG: adenosylcobinamide-phosphate synthase [Solirubrobacteraceae bacterium]|jgi:adenosylcobinamide-phosphate synthase|nr:adenosylcobinamide-phosphate synthase [Solirubrobacteraceae bacterium]
MSGAALAGGYAADVIFGDPRRWHPVAGFGRLALAVERAAYRPTRLRGALFAGGLVGAAGVGGELLARGAVRAGLGRGAALAAITWAALGGRSLAGTARTLATHVERGDLEGARATLPSLCGRDPDGLDETQICRAAVESVAENTSDAVVGALLWGALIGPAGVAAYRAANTLDAMVGHHSERYESFGWAAARADDAMSWPGARATAALSALCAPVVGGSRTTAWRTLRTDGAAHPSPNAGYVEAAFAGALGVRLGGPLTYGGVAQLRPLLGGAGREPTSRDVHRAARLSWAVGAAAAGLCAIARAARSGSRAAARTTPRAALRAPARATPSRALRAAARTTRRAALRAPARTTRRAPHHTTARTARAAALATRLRHRTPRPGARRKP